MSDNRTDRIKKLEAELSYLINDSMSPELKLKRLSDAYSQAFNSGYCDAMANKLMAGIEDDQTRVWEKNCNYKYKIGELIDLLNAETEEAR